MLKELAVIGTALLALAACSSDPDRGWDHSLTSEAEDRIRTEGTEQLKLLGLKVTGKPVVYFDKTSVYAVDGNGCSLVIHRDAYGRLGLDVRWEDNQQLGSVGEDGERGAFWFTDLEALKQRAETKSCKFTPSAPAN